jgi:hypothetical protein
MLRICSFALVVALASGLIACTYLTSGSSSDDLAKKHHPTEPDAGGCADTDAPPACGCGGWCPDAFIPPDGWTWPDGGWDPPPDSGVYVPPDAGIAPNDGGAWVPPDAFVGWPDAH